MKSVLKWIGITFLVLVVFRILAGPETRGGGTSGTDSPAAGAKPAAPQQTIYRTTAQNLFASYQTNEVATDEELKGKIVEVSGTLDSIDKDFTDAVILRLRTGNEFMSANMYLVDSEKQKAIALRKADKVVLRCPKMTRIIGSPVGSDCRIVESKR